jgi:MFS family permease
MSGASVGFMLGPSLGGWLYEIGGIRLPFLTVGVMALFAAVAFTWIEIPEVQAVLGRVPMVAVLRIPAVASCFAAVVAASATISMLEPVLPLFLSARLGLGPTRIGFVFGISAVVSSMLHPIFGQLADRSGGRRLTMIGLVLVACVLPLLSRAWSYQSAIGLNALQAATMACVITPSLAYMAEVTSHSGVGSFGVAYGVYNLAWGVGLLGGPALGGFLFERMGFASLVLCWSPVLVIVTILLTKATSKSG